MIYKKIARVVDKDLIFFFRVASVPIARLSLFIVFFWFGILKVFNLSPADTIVESLLLKTLPSFISYDSFFVFLGLYEMAIGISFLIPRLERLAMALLIPHMITTFLPLIFLTEVTWNGFLIPTLEGQYIIKNLVIVALAFGVAAHLHPLKRFWF